MKKAVKSEVCWQVLNQDSYPATIAYPGCDDTNMMIFGSLKGAYDYAAYLRDDLKINIAHYKIRPVRVSKAKGVSWDGAKAKRPV